MPKLSLNSDPKVASVFDNYPEEVQPKMKQLRTWILEVAEENEHVEKLVETLKWGEPSYLTKSGSTLRMDWKAKSPNEYVMYFNCQTSIVETIRSIYGNLFRYEKNRAVIFDIDQEIPKNEVKDCIEMALTYHKVKDKPFFGRV